MNDRLEFSIDGVRASIENMRQSNEMNKQNKHAYLDYVSNELAPAWNTANGQASVEELKSFANTKFDEYIRYLDRKIDDVENVVLPALENINNA